MIWDSRFAVLVYTIDSFDLLRIGAILILVEDQPTKSAKPAPLEQPHHFPRLSTSEDAHRPNNDGRISRCRIPYKAV